MKSIAYALTGLLMLATLSCSSRPEAIRIGAVYPTTGSSEETGTAEWRGVALAAELVDADGGVNGRRIKVDHIDVPSPDSAPGAVRHFAESGIRLVLGSHASTISRVAAAEAARRGMLYWETGAVGDMTGAGAGDLVFRVSPTGVVLGHGAVSFIADQIAPRLHRRAETLRFAIANIDDVYGNTVARGAVDEVHARHMRFAGRFSYPSVDYDMRVLVRRIAAAKPDVLFVSSYLDDAVAMRREMVRQHLHLLASIGTSSSYCMKDFGEELGAAANGLFASDKPDALLNPSGLVPQARALLSRANAAYKQRYHEDMDSPALAGFSAAWALFHDVMPRARSLEPGAIGAAAREVSLPDGSLPNGSGLAFGAPGSADAGANLRAASVIWEWVRPGVREVVWPRQYATASIRSIPLAV